MVAKQHDKCTVPGCENRHDSRGYCPKHYARFRTHGNAFQVGYDYKRPRKRLPLKYADISLKERIEAQLDIKHPSLCWNWTGTLPPSSGAKRCPMVCESVEREDGTHRSVNLGVAREMYKIYVGDITYGEAVCWKCDNYLCANPSHLYKATTAESNRARDRDGRFISLEEATPHNMGLSPDKVKLIKYMLRNGIKGRFIADKYNISASLVSSIKVGRLWGHVLDDIIFADLDLTKQD